MRLCTLQERAACITAELTAELSTNVSSCGGKKLTNQHIVQSVGHRSLSPKKSNSNMGNVKPSNKSVLGTFTSTLCNQNPYYRRIFFSRKIRPLSEITDSTNNSQAKRVQWKPLMIEIYLTCCCTQQSHMQRKLLIIEFPLQGVSHQSLKSVIKVIFQHFITLTDLKGGCWPECAPWWQFISCNM